MPASNQSSPVVNANHAATSAVGSLPVCKKTHRTAVVKITFTMTMASTRLLLNSVLLRTHTSPSAPRDFVDTLVSLFSALLHSHHPIAMLFDFAFDVCHIVADGRDAFFYVFQLDFYSCQL